MILCQSEVWNGFLYFLGYWGLVLGIVAIFWGLMRGVDWLANVEAPAWVYTGVKRTTLIVLVVLFAFGAFWAPASVGALRTYEDECESSCIGAGFEAGTATSFEGDSVKCSCSTTQRDYRSVPRNCE